jgi:hypothetical protein
MIQKDPPPWLKVFLELAVRALRRLNYEFAPWTIGQSSHADITNKLGMINSSDGLKYVLETEVCTGITLEFMHSGFTNGGWIFDDSRRYSVDREITIDSKRVDLFVNRYTINDTGEKSYSANPVLIEAKRVKYFIPDLKEGEGRGFDNYDKITEDINKLKEVRSFIQNNGKIRGYDKFNFDNPFIYVMFWGLTDKPKELRTEIMKELECPEKDLENCNIRFFPTKWEQSGPEITEWGWVCLFEIDPPADPVFNPKKHPGA